MTKYKLPQKRAKTGTMPSQGTGRKKSKKRRK